MPIKKITGIDAIAFDIDGTIYPTWKFAIEIFPFFIRHIRFMNAFGKVRHALHKRSLCAPDEGAPDFFYRQNELLAERLTISYQEAADFLEKEVYSGWKKHFLRIRPYPFVYETITRLKKEGFKIGVLSDFPPDQKGDVWGILPLCDAAVDSEQVGALKPSRLPFLQLARDLDTPCERILYVGNHKQYDVGGAASVGMKTAHIASPFVSCLTRKPPRPDISFSGYRQFLCSVL